MNKLSTNSKGLAGWIDDFIIGLSKKAGEVQEEEPKELEEVTAEINLDDLDKVVWKGETFRVHFDDKGANIINEFGNVVTTIPDVTTIEDVDKKLNSQEIVTAEEDEDLENAISKLAESLEEEVDEDKDDKKLDKKEVEVKDAPKGKEEPKKDVKDDKKDVLVKEECDVCAADENEDDEVFAAVADGFDTLEKTIASLSERLSAVEQMYARKPQFEDVSNSAPEDEFKHFTETADEAAKELSREHGVDISTPAGRVELSVHPQEAGDDVDVSSTYNQMEEVAHPGNPAGEAPVAPKAEAPKAPETEEKVESPVKEEAPKTEEKPHADLEKDEDESEEEAPKEEVQKLSGRDEKIFQKGICPETGEELLKSSKVAGNFLGVYSPKGGTEYAVDLRSGDIYRFTGK